MMPTGWRTLAGALAVLAMATDANADACAARTDLGQEAWEGETADRGVYEADASRIAGWLHDHRGAAASTYDPRTGMLDVAMLRPASSSWAATAAALELDLETCGLSVDRIRISEIGGQSSSGSPAYDEPGIYSGWGTERRRRIEPQYRD